MPRYAIAEKRPNMKFHAAATFREFPTLQAFMEDPEVVRAIMLNNRFGDTWKIMEWVEDEKKPHKVAHEGTSGGQK